MATTVSSAFSKYKTNLELTDRQESLVSSYRKRVVDRLGAKLCLHSEQSRVIGSWDRKTLTRYLSEADVDVMVILHHGHHNQWDTADGTVKVLDRFKAILDDAYPLTSKRRDRNCITLQFSEFRLDVVPAFKLTGGNYKIPDSVRKQWVNTDPIAFAARLTYRNFMMDGTFIPLIKMIKGWNRNVGWPIRSFHLECLLQEHFKGRTSADAYPSMLVDFFESLPMRLKYKCYDPVTSDQVDSYLDNTAIKSRRQFAIEKAEQAARDAREAYDDQTKYPNAIHFSINEWQQLLGEFFPVYG